MNRYPVVFGCAVLAFFSTVCLVGAQFDPPKEEKKQTTLGKYVNAKQAYEMWEKDPKAVKILDARSVAEYVFVGHAPMAVNIPAEFWTGTWNPGKNKYPFRPNPTFEEHVKAKYKADDTILVLCRSGGRSARAVNRLAKVGFTNVYSVVDGTEGDKVKDALSYYNGKRMRNGWKNSGAPWTYKLNPELVYIQPK